MSPCHGAKAYLKFVDEKRGTELPPPAKVSLSKEVVVACIYLTGAMCKALPYAKGGSPSIAYPGTKKVICDGPNTPKTES